MTKITPRFHPCSVHGEIVAHPREAAVSSSIRFLQPTREGAAALAAARDLARKSSAPATLRAYKSADWTHFSDWCAAKSFVPVPAASEVVSAYLANLAEAHCRPLSGADSPRSEKCTAATTCRGTPRTVPFRGRCRACCANTAARPKRPPACRWRCCASCSAPATTPRAAGATARCCCLVSPVRSTPL